MSCVFSDILLILFSIFSVSLFTLFVEAETSSIVADNSSIIAEISFALSPDAATFDATAPTTLSSTLELLIILPIIFCNVSINALIPFAVAPISSLDVTVIRFVKSPFPFFILLMISFNSLCCLFSGLIIQNIRITITKATATATPITRPVAIDIVALYVLSCPSVLSFVYLLFASINTDTFDEISLLHSSK